MLRSFSRKFSISSNPKKQRKTLPAPPTSPKVELQDRPVPTTRTMTTANLFNTMQASSTQTTGMDRTLYEIPQPQTVEAMTDLIKNHSEGDKFPYVGIVGKEGETPDARRARMLALKPSYNKRDIPEIKILGCPLISREGDFTMETLMAYAQANTEPVPLTGAPMPNGAHSPNYVLSKPFVHIKQITILYTPNMSSTSNYCNFWMNLIDNRLVDCDKGSQTNIVVSNQESILEMSCDYCVSSADLRSFSLSYSLERDIVHPGFQWGTASFFFSISESDLPYQSSKVDALAVYRMPVTTLQSRTTNADKSDISFTPADIQKIREMYTRGDIVDVDEPQHARLKPSIYSKSSIRAVPKGQKIETEGKAGWEFMQGAVRPMMDAHEASVDPDDIESDVPIREVNLEEINNARKSSLQRYREQQERERLESEATRLKAQTEVQTAATEKQVIDLDVEQEPNELNDFFGGSSKKKQVRLTTSEV
jgi:hypothetical protein